MAAELIFVTIGLGHLLSVGRDFNDMNLVIAVMLVIIAVGLAVDRAVFGTVESWVQDRWGLSQA